MVKYIFVTGGVMSSLGKGIVSSSTANLMLSAGYRVASVKIDPYINVDAGTMNPYAHGEVFVTDDGYEADLDMGHYERFTGMLTSRDNNITTGQVYQSVISNERRGTYLGKCVQLVPHITDEIKRRLREVSAKNEADITIVEVGGTVGDLESQPFLEAIRQMRLDEPAGSVMYMHVAHVPFLKHTNELKTKPLQHSVQELRRIGIQPDMILCRSEGDIGDDIRQKVALFTSVPYEMIVSDPDASSIYEVPLILESQGMTNKVLEVLHLEKREADTAKWKGFVDNMKSAKKVLEVYMIGKYTDDRDSYMSITEAIHHSAAAVGATASIHWVESTHIEDGMISVDSILDDNAGYVILPGFGKRGTEGKIAALRELRARNVPVLGICFGLQLMAIEIARNVVGIEGAGSSELDPGTKHPIIDMLEEQKKVRNMGGTMRLGSKRAELVEGTMTYGIYGKKEVFERHRHRYEINPEYVDALSKAGFVVSGYSDEGFPDFMELKGNAFYVGTQGHPEFKSRPLSPAPLFRAFMEAVAKRNMIVADSIEGAEIQKK